MSNGNQGFRKEKAMGSKGFGKRREDDGTQGFREKKTMVNRALGKRK